MIRRREPIIGFCDIETLEFTNAMNRIRIWTDGVL